MGVRDRARVNPASAAAQSLSREGFINQRRSQRSVRAHTPTPVLLSRPKIGPGVIMFSAR